MRVLHFGDIHFWRIGTDVDFYYLKRILGPINLIARRRKSFPPDHAKRIAADILEREADLVIFSGDATTMSLPREYEMAKRALLPMREKWGEKFFAIPGNHDRYSPHVLKRNYWEGAFPFSPYDQKRVHTLEAGESLGVVGFDASVPFKIRSNGLFTDSLRDELEKELTRVSELGRKILLVGHFPFSYPPDVIPAGHHKLLGEELLAETVAKFKPAVYCHGHKHIRWALRAPSSPETLCLDCGASGMASSSPEKQAGYLEFDLDEASGKVSAIEARVLVGEVVESRPMEVPTS